MCLSGACACNAQEIADLFGEYFQGVYVRDNSQEDFVVDGGIEDSSTVLLIQLEERTVERGIVALDTQKGPGFDGIKMVVKKPLAIWFNLSLFSGVFLCMWKESYVVPLFKSGSGDKRNISKYPGISILSAIPKLFEKLVWDVITPIIRPSISDEQHGFVDGRSTVTSLVEFSNFVLSEMEDGLQVDAVYIDFSKVFDRDAR
jgi:hypothetical protein